MTELLLAAAGGFLGGIIAVIIFRGIKGWLGAAPMISLEPEWEQPEQPPTVPEDVLQQSPRYPHQLIDASMPLTPEMQKKVSRELRGRLDDVQRQTQLPEQS